METAMPPAAAAVIDDAVRGAAERVIGAGALTT
jgi:hypothetical protein